MSKGDGVMIYLGEYGDRDDAIDDFEAIKQLKHAELLGMYESALFEKTIDGALRIINTDSTERTFGAKVGAVTGGVIGLLFPPSILAAAAMGTGIGAIVGHLRRGLKTEDIESMADLLHPGEYGVVVVAETTIKQGFDKLMTHASATLTRGADVDPEELALEADAEAGAS